MKLGFSTFVRAAIEVLYSRLSIRDQNENFEDFALYTYGKTIAERFLLNYSQQLWGAPCRQLSVNIAGKRMRGLNLRTFITEAAFWQKGETKHLEGSTFYYPNRGIGTIMDKLGQFCGTENIALNSNITRILHDRSRILEVEVNGSKRIEVGEVVSTLPLNLLLRIMEPKPPEEIIELAQSVRYRHMVLIALFLNRDSVTKAATVYFPDSDCSFTRVCEPKNRNQYMSPPGKTSLVAEIPCQTDDEFWNMDDHELVDLVRSRLMHMNWIKEEEIIDTLVTRIPYSYPILEVGFEEKINEISRFLNSFPNLTISGRNGRFVYAWIHDMMQFGREIIEDYNTRA
jgi:protoporphyrinogen oxidase